ncbi:amino acid adenylation domain-containing protein [Pseudomonas tohonis]|uniref:non-ribosomal peptide synthetase n=1 Tax=Pseudomonas tohonis TaxID=2725477 RepID=UPI0021DB19A8|nr:non-ribosomal peptide synthetase [Pseudomonas tohonis]UXY50548.1 amino acid adenylation domain-containing protein [Pseudomonas tohonis]
MKQLPSLPDDDLLALLLADEGEPSDAIRRLPDPGPRQLSFAQQRLWLAQQIDPQGSAYNLPRAFTIRGPLQADLLEIALGKVVDRHDILRSRFEAADGTPRQCVDASATVPLEVHDLSALAAAEREERRARHIRREAATPFDLARAPLLRCTLLRMGRDEHTLLLTLHHIVSDAWSNPILMQDLTRGYLQAANGDDRPLPRPAIQYADYAHWQREVYPGSAAFESAHHYWRTYLGADVPPLALPLDRAPQPIAPATARQLAHDLPGDLVQRLGARCQALGVAPFVMLLGAWQLLLARYSGQREFTVGVPNAGRNRAETQELVGCFVNTQVYKARIDGAQTGLAFLQGLRQQSLAAMEHADYPIEYLLEHLDLQRSAEGNPLFQTLFNWRVADAGTVAPAIAGLSIEPLEAGEQDAKFDLSLDVESSPHGLRATLEYRACAFDEDTVARIARHWQHLLQGLVEQPERPLGELATQPEQERQARLAQSRGPVVAPALQPIHLAIADQARATPEAPAVRFEQRTLSYAELERQANRLAHRLLAEGVGPDVRVGIALPRCPELVIALLAVLKAGGAYVPLDPGYPRERLAYMIEDSAIAVLLTQAALAVQLPVPDALPTLELDAARPIWSEGPAHAIDAAAHPEQLAYMIYTSGSTGRPKGVQVRHGALSNHMQWMLGAIPLCADDRVLQKTAISFDASVWEFWLPLMSGAQLVLGSSALAEDLSLLWREVAEHRITHLQMAPSLMRGLLPHGQVGQLDSLRLLALGGEALDNALLRQIGQHWAGPLVNLYGPTESTIDACFQRFDLGEAPGEAMPPIGRAIDNLACYVLDEHLQPCPIGVSGELYIGGAGLARGYHGQPALTAERFVADPFSDGGRLYRTGDLARYRQDGRLECLGRTDHQVKIRGLRIELGEIEAAIAQLPLVHQAAVLAVDMAAGRQLAAYWSPRESARGDEQALRTELMQALAQRLPEHMVPAHWVMLDRLPLTANGKLDRAALPHPDASATQRPWQAPQNELERRIAAIWQEVLKRERIGIDENFFELGGDSILSIQVVSRARQDGLRFTPRDLFNNQTIRGLATVAQVLEHDAPVADQGPVTGAAPLLPVQHAFFERDLPQRHHWNQSVLLRPAQSLQPDLLTRALHALVSHHDALRMAFHQRADGWHAEYRGLYDDPELLWQHRLERLADLEPLAQQAQRSLDLAKGPLLRALLVDCADEGQRLLVVIHHLVVDGVSWRILLDDLQTAYRQIQAGEPLQLPAKTSAFRQWGERLQAYAATRAGQALHWADEPACGDVLPGARADASLSSRHAETVDICLDPERTAKLLNSAPAAYRTRINDLLLTALARALCRWTGAPSALVELEGHGREDLFDELDLTRTVGWFTSLYPVRLAPQGDIGASIKAIKEQLRAVRDNGIAFGALRYLGDEETRRRLAALPTPRVTFNYLGQFDGSFDDASGAFLAPCAGPTGDERDAAAPLGNWLTINGQVYDGRLGLSWTFSREMFDRDAIAAVANDCLAEIEQLVEHCCTGRALGVTPSDFPLARLDQAQLDALPVAAEDIEDIFPLSPMQEGLLVHTLLERHSGIYFMQECYVIREALDYAEFRSAWRQVIQRHEAVRASFVWNTGGELLQVIRRAPEVDVALLDLSLLPADEAKARIEAMLEAERKAGFDLADAPPIRFHLFRLPDRTHLFVMSNHHILLDAWCRSLLMADFFEIYRARLEGRQEHLETPYRFRHFIEWLQRQAPEAAEAFWRQQLEGFEQPTALPMDRPPVGEQAAPSAIDDNYTWLELDESRLLQERATQHRLTLNTFVQAAWALTLHHHSRARDLVFGVTVSGRPAHIPEMQRTVGLFINSVPLRVGIPEPHLGTGVLEWLQGILATNVAMREYDYLPLVKIQACSALQPGLSLFDTLFVYENAPLDDSVGEDARNLGVAAESSRTHTNYPITAVIYPGEQMGLHLSYDTRYFDRATMDAMLARFRGFLVALAHGLEGPVEPLLDAGADDPEQVLRHNRTQVGHDLSTGYVAQFEARVDRHPERIAASCEARSWTYRELDGHANRLGNRLVEAAVVPDQAVALLADRDLELLGMMIGTFKAGAGYLPLDPSHPDERLSDILQRSRAPALVCTAAHRQRALALIAGAQREIELIVWESLPHGPHREARPGIPTGPRHLAYVIFTSGSTGQPKGVMVEQAGMLNNQLSKVPYLGLDEHDVIAQTASQAFDISVWQFLTAPLYGAQVRIFPDAVSRHPAALLEQTRAHRISVLEIVPALIQAMLEEPPQPLPGLRWLLPTGEALPAETAAAWLRRYPGIPMVNAYGPAECSDDVAFCTLTPASAQRPVVPIGHPTDNNRLYLLDDYLALVPDGATGEIGVAGIGVGRGYCADPVRTALQFVPNPFALVPGERLYRTGDLARRRTDDHALEYIGRVDHQVKIHGFRIEPGEIEARIAQYPGIREAAVLVCDSGRGKQLVAFLTLHEGAEALAEDLERLRAFLKSQLPAYMVPPLFQVLEQMPRNANGKLDRKVLATLELRTAAQLHRPPEGALQEGVAAIWRAVLGIEQVGQDDNFFALGGNSLLATQVISRVHLELKIEAPLASLFESATFEDFAGRLAAHQTPTTDSDLSDLFDLLDVLETH